MSTASDDENILLPNSDPTHAPEDFPPVYPGYQWPPPGEGVPPPDGPRCHHPLQRRYIAICAFFLGQAHAEDRELEFWNQCLARFFLQWPLCLTPNMMGTYLNQVKNDILNDIELASSCVSCQQVKPFIHWEYMFTLSAAQFDEAGAQMLSEQSQIEYEGAGTHTRPLIAASPSPPPSPVAGPSTISSTSRTEASTRAKKKVGRTASVNPLPGRNQGNVIDLTVSPSRTGRERVIDLTWIDEVMDMDTL